MPRHRLHRTPGGRLLLAVVGVSALGAAVLTATAGATEKHAPTAASADRHGTDHGRHPRPRPTGVPSANPITPVPSGPSTTAPSATTSTAPAAPQGGYVPVNQAEWAADLAAFEARTPAPLPAGKPRDIPEFNALCKVFHRASDDPIVVPGLPGASHNHTFFGNETTNYASTYDSLKGGGGTCDPAGDHSAYWVPTLYLDGQPVDPAEVTVYYGSQVTRERAKDIKTIPRGLRMIVGNATQTTGNANDHGFWCSAGEKGRTADDVFPICKPGGNLIRYVVYPSCWDGKNLDSPDHKSHMAYPANGACTATHPVSLPTVTYTMSYPERVSVSDHGFTLASGGGSPYSMHGDFFNAWEPAALAQRVKDCLNQHVKCNSAGEL